MDNVWVDTQTHLTPSPVYTFIRYVKRILENTTALMWIRECFSLLGGSSIVFMLVASKGIT